MQKAVQLLCPSHTMGVQGANVGEMGAAGKSLSLIQLPFPQT